MPSTFDPNIVKPTESSERILSDSLGGRAVADGSQPSTFDIPISPSRKRLSPALDPIARMRLTASAKWMLVIGIILLVLWIPVHFYRSQPLGSALDASRATVAQTKAAIEKAQRIAGSRRADSDTRTAALDEAENLRLTLAHQTVLLTTAQAAFARDKIIAERSNLAPVIAATILAAILATGLPRLLLPRVFGRWREAVEAIRDWLIVGLATGALYLTVLTLLKQFKVPPENAFLSNLFSLSGATQQLYDPIWLKFRLPLLFACALFGLLIARRVALRAEGIVASNAVKAMAEVLIQAAIIGLLDRPLERMLDHAGQVPLLGAGLLTLTSLLIVGAIGFISWAADADRHVIEMHRRGHPLWTGVDAGERPVPMTLSVIGGRESGKTVFMAAAYYEWLTSSFGNLRIKPAAHIGGRGIAPSSGTDLEQVADELYVNNQFPTGTVSTQNLPFDIAFGKEAVCQFSMLDFPGGAVVGRAADQVIVREFWERLDDSDALLIIADMSYVRRGKKDPGFTQVFAAYMDAMHRLIDRNGSRRVIPVALVLTKCDEYFDPTTGRLNIPAIRSGLEEFGYAGLESAWNQMCGQAGQKIVEFSTWMTSAITFSEPQIGEDGEYDYARPYRIIPPPPAITPTGCAAPILWLTAKVMRWNVTAFRDLSSFLYGSSPKMHRRIEAIVEMERVAEEKQAKA